MQSLPSTTGEKFMHCLSIQIKPSAASSFDQVDFLERVRQIGRSPEIDSFSEKGQDYLNYNFFTEQPHTLWNQLKTHLYDHPQYGSHISPISIVVCEGQQQEDDLLLHHFDAGEKLDHF